MPRMTSGEKRFSERLEQKLEDDYLIWYDIAVGRKYSKPDFVVLHPRRGLLVLEVKDWRLDSIHEMDRESFALLTERGLVRERNPVAQARFYATEICSLLERDPQLLQASDSRYAGKLTMPWAYGVVLANISRLQFSQSGMADFIPEHLVICQDEMYESVDSEAFQLRMWNMFPQAFKCLLSLPQIDRIRWHLFPEVRVASGSQQFGLFDRQAGQEQPLLDIPDIIRVMDLQQEQLARSLGDGHRIIHGVAGSGKTMILGYRCLHLVRALSKPVLVLCYNRTLAARLTQILAAQGLAGKVDVRSFHAWCRQMLVAYHVELPKQGNGFWDALVPSVMAGVESGQIPRAQYGAVLIDEGHDFQPDWYRLVVQMVDPATNALLVLYDDAQNIYGKAERRKFTWKSVGINAVGHTSILKVNYRNTLEVLSVARGFADKLLKGHDSDDDGVPLVAPVSAGRRGAMPELLRVEDAHAQSWFIVDRIREEQAQGRVLSDMAVLFRSNSEGENLAAALHRAGIPNRLAGYAGKDTLFAEGDSVKLVSMHSSKGLEFPVVIIPGLGGMPRKNEDEEQEARLLYVAMTRATEKLFLVHDADSSFSDRLRDAIRRVDLQLSAV